MKTLENTRFGSINYDEATIIAFPEGVIGFPKDHRFILIERVKGPVSYLQSIDSSWLALPVLDGSAISPTYPNMSVDRVATLIGARTEGLAIMVVVTVVNGALHANLLAPILIDAEKRIAKQFILDDAQYSASTPIQAAPTAPARTADNPITEAASSA
jgi:flagellar assembly factor FliW